MLQARFRAVLVAAIFVADIGTSVAVGPTELSSGRLYAGELFSHSDSVEVVVESDRNQIRTFAVRSPSFTPWIKLYCTSEAGAPSFEGGALKDPWGDSTFIVVELEKGDRCRIQIHALYETWGGPFELSVREDLQHLRVEGRRPTQDLANNHAQTTGDRVLETRSRLEGLLPPVLTPEASTAELMRLLPGNQLLGLWEPRWQELRLQFGLVERIEPVFEEVQAALAVYEQYLAPEHLAFAEAKLRLAELVWTTGDVVEAGRLITEAESLLEAKTDSHHPLLGLAHLAKGRWLRRVGALQESLVQVKEALSIFKSVVGERSLAVSLTQEELGAVHWDRGDIISAEALLQLALRTREAVLGDNHPANLTAAKSLGVVQLAQMTSNYDPAYFVPHGEKRQKGGKKKKQSRQQLGEEASHSLAPLRATFERVAQLTQGSGLDLGQLDRAWALAVLEWTKGDRESIEASAEARKQAKRLLTQNRSHAVMKRRADHVSTWSPRLYPLAQKSYERSLKRLMKKARPSWRVPARAADGRRDRAESLLRSGELRLSKNLLFSVDRLASRALGPDHLETALARAELANQVWRSGGYFGKAVQWMEESLKVLETKLGADSLPVALATADLAVMRAEMGQYEKSIPLALRARSILQAQLAPDSPVLARHGTKVAWALRVSGRFAEMEATLLGVPSDRSFSICTALHLNKNLMLADLRVREGDLETAKKLVREEVNRCGGKGALAKSLQPLQGILAEDYEAREKPRNATGLDDFAHRGKKRKKLVLKWGGGILFLAAPFSVGLASFLAPIFEPIATITNALGSTAVFLGLSYTVSSPFVLAKNLGNPSYELAPVLDPTREASYYQVVGAVLHEAGLNREAAALHRGAIEGMETGAAKDHPKLSGIYTDLAEVLWDTVEPSGELRGQDEKKALEAAQRSAAILDEFLYEVLAVLPEQQALNLISARGHPERVLFSGLLYASRPKERWLEAAWEWTLRKRSLVVDELAFRHQQALAADSPEVAQAWEEFVEARRRLATLWVRGPEAGYSHWPELQEALDAREQAEEALVAASAGYRAAKQYRELEFEDVARALPRRSALVEYVRVAVRAPGQREGSDHYIALIADALGQASFVDLGPASELDELVGAWLKRLRESYDRLRPETAADISGSEEAGRELRTRVWDPVVQKLEEVDLIFVVLDGSLHQIHFAALPSDSGGFVLESGPGVHTLSSGRDLVRIQAADASEADGMLALGNPDFDAISFRAGSEPKVAGVYRGRHARCGTFRQLQWEALPESEREVEEIALLYGKLGPVSLLTGPEATEERFKREAPGKRLLHVATHGFFLQDDCPTPGRTDRGIGRLITDEDPAVDPPLTFGENPLLLSGLVLAGANHAVQAEGESEDGILTAEELAALDLRGLQIAALSACDTGLGTVETGEGVFGLRRALETAGARTILMSLWSVPDESARRWMIDFYARIFDGQSVQTASREASRAGLELLRAKGTPEHPYLWSGFVAAGDWR